MDSVLSKPRLITRYALLTVFAESLIPGHVSDVTMASDLMASDLRGGDSSKAHQKLSFPGTASEVTVASDLTGNGSKAHQKLSSQPLKGSAWTAFIQQCAYEIVKHAAVKVQRLRGQRSSVPSPQDSAFFSVEITQGDLTDSGELAQTNKSPSVGTLVMETRSGPTHSKEAEQNNPTLVEELSSTYYLKELARLTNLSLLPKDNEEPLEFSRRISNTLKTWFMSQAGSANSDDKGRNRVFHKKRKKLTCTADLLAPAVATALHFLNYPEERLSPASYWLNAFDNLDRLNVQNPQSRKRITLLSNPQAITRSESPGCHDPEKATREFLSRFDEQEGRLPLRTCFSLALHVAAKNDPGLFSMNALTAKQLRAMARELLAKPHGFRPAQKADAAEYLDQIYATMPARRCVAFLNSSHLSLLFEGFYPRKRASDYSDFRHLMSAVTKAWDDESLHKRIAEMVKRSRCLWDYLSTTMLVLCCAKLIDPATSILGDSEEEISEVMVEFIRGKFTKTSNQRGVFPDRELCRSTRDSFVPTKQRREDWVEQP